MDTNKQQNYLAPFITMVILFFFVGFLTCINQQFQGPIKKVFLDDPSLQNIKFTLGTIIIFSWFLAYPLTGNTGANWVTKYGYKGTMIRALGVLAVGLGIFTFSAWYEVNVSSRVDIAGYNIPVAYFIFILGSYVAGAGVTIMQVVINPYLVNCAVKGTSGVQRQNMGGSANSIGTTIAPLFLTYVVFGGMASEDITINQVILPFAVLTAVILVVSFVVSKLKLPTIPNTVSEVGEKLPKSIWSFRHLTLGVVAIFFYVGVEVSVGTYVVDYAKSLDGSFAANAALMASLYWGAMLVGRLVGSSLSKVSARTQLVFTSVAAAVLCLVATLMQNPWILVAMGLVHSIMWSAIFTLAIDGLGKYTSKGSGALMIGVLGGGIIPLVQSMMADYFGGFHITWYFIVACECYLIFYALAGSRHSSSEE